MEAAIARGVGEEQLVLDPGPTSPRPPRRASRSCARLGSLHDLGRPLLLAVSRKDFVGAITRRRPRERLAGTLAALWTTASAPARTCCACTRSRRSPTSWRCARCWRGERDLAADLRLDDSLRWERQD